MSISPEYQSGSFEIHGQHGHPSKGTGSCRRSDFAAFATAAGGGSLSLAIEPVERLAQWIVLAAKHLYDHGDDVAAIEPDMAVLAGLMMDAPDIAAPAFDVPNDPAHDVTGLQAERTADAVKSVQGALALATEPSSVVQEQPPCRKQPRRMSHPATPRRRPQIRDLC